MSGPCVILHVILHVIAIISSLLDPCAHLHQSPAHPTTHTQHTYWSHIHWSGQHSLILYLLILSAPVDLTHAHDLILTHDRTHTCDLTHTCWSLWSHPHLLILVFNTHTCWSCAQLLHSIISYSILTLSDLAFSSHSWWSHTQLMYSVISHPIPTLTDPCVQHWLILCSIAMLADLMFTSCTCWSHIQFPLLVILWSEGCWQGAVVQEWDKFRHLNLEGVPSRNNPKTICWKACWGLNPWYHVTNLEPLSGMCELLLVPHIGGIAIYIKLAQGSMHLFSFFITASHCGATSFAPMLQGN